MKTLPNNLIVLFFLALMLVGQATPVLAASATNVTASDGLFGGWVRIDWEFTQPPYEGEPPPPTWIHNVERSDSAGGPYTWIGEIENEKLLQKYFYEDKTAVTEATYFYRVRTCVASDCEISANDSGWRAYVNAVTRISAGDGANSNYTFAIWDRDTTVEYYEVYRSSTIGGTRTLIGTTTDFFFFDYDVSPATTFYYYARACVDDGTIRCSIFNDYDVGQRKWPVVKNVVASDGGQVGFVRVTWDAVGFASGYRIYYSEDNGSTFAGYETVTGVESYDYYLPLVGFGYSFAVTPCFDADCGVEKSTPDVGWMDHPAPANLQASEGNSSTLLTWDEVDSNAVYYVFRDYLDEPEGTVLAGYTAASESFEDNFAGGALPGTDYNYWVVACPDSAASATDPGCSSYSAPDLGYYLPPAVENLAASDGTSQDYILVTWDAVEGAASYAVERTANVHEQPPVWTGPYASATTSFKDTSAIEGVKYWYVAKACGKQHCGAPGASGSGYLQGVCYALTLNTVGTGTVSASPENSLGCPGGQYIEGELIALTANADPGGKLESWINTDDDDSTSSVNQVTMPANARTVTAAFSLVCEALSLQTTGSGSLEADPLASTGCENGSYVEGEVITLTANPDSTWSLDEWLGTDNDSSTANTNQYTMTSSPHTVTANFSRQCQALSLNTVGNGSLVADPEFSTGCPNGSFAEGEVIGLNASPDPNWQVDGWSGTDNDTITADVNQYTMTTSAHAVTVTFALDCNTLNLIPEGNGSVTANPLSSIGCPSGTYKPGEIISLNAVPGSNWVVESWNNTDDDLSTELTNTCTMGLNDTLDVRVVFIMTDESFIFTSGFEN